MLDHAHGIPASAGGRRREPGRGAVASIVFAEVSPDAAPSAASASERERPAARGAANARAGDDGLTEALRRVIAARAGTPGALVTRLPEHTKARPLQRKVELTTGGGSVTPEEVVKRLKARSRVLPAEEDPRIGEKVLGLGAVSEGLRRLSDSAVDYGTFDLRHDQDLVFLYYELRKHVVVPKKRDYDPKTEVAETVKSAERHASERRKERFKTGDVGRTYELALLGTGASIAYYITANKHRIERGHTIAIGKKQPWAEERGPGVVNHPLHMITALRDEVGLGDEALADRSTFSKLVDKVITDNVCLKLDADITTVGRVAFDGTGFYAIRMQHAGRELCYYARRVVAGLGIGGHVEPSHRTDRGVKQDSLGGRAMNMDEFQRRATAIRGGQMPRPDITVVIAGPNAGIDAVKTAMECGFKIIWVTGSKRPAFLPGTDNELVETEYDKRVDNRESRIHEIIKDYAYQAVANTSQGLADKPILVDTCKSKPRLVPADYYVWAQGPDVSTLKRIFSEDQDLSDFVRARDTNRQFAGERAAVIGLHTGDPSNPSGASLEIIGGAAYRLLGAVPRGTDEDDDPMGKVITSLPLNVLVNDQLTPVRSQIEAAAAFVPGYVRDEVNFATDSRTVIAIHIAVRYPHLSNAQIDEWVDRIVRWRRPSDDELKRYPMLWGPIPNPNNRDRESARSFTDWFERRLGEENEKARIAQSKV